MADQKGPAGDHAAQVHSAAADAHQKIADVHRQIHDLKLQAAVLKENALSQSGAAVPEAVKQSLRAACW